MFEFDKKIRKSNSIPSTGLPNIPCPTCKRPQNGKVLLGLKVDWQDRSDQDILGQDQHQILQCNGCDTIFYCLLQSNSEDVVPVGIDEYGDLDYDYNETRHYYPALRKREYPKWMSYKFRTKHSGLFDLLEGIYFQHNQNLSVFAAIGIRTCFEALTETLGVPNELNFGEKISQLRRDGHISPREEKSVSTLVDAGNAAVHRGWRPKDDDIEIMLDALEGIIHRSIVLPEGLDELEAEVPKRK